MRFDRIRKLGSVVLACFAVFAVSLFASHQWVEEGTKAEAGQSETLSMVISEDPFDQVARKATLAALDKKYYEEGTEIGTGCLTYGDISFLLHPDTDPEIKAEIIRQMEEFYSNEAGRGKEGYNYVSRWTTTATDGAVPTMGTPITLLWSFMPDGVTMPANYPGEVTSPNILHAVFDTTFNTPDQWKNKIRSAFTIWGDMLGTTYIEVAYDDGAAFPTSAGVVGVRADIRMGGHSIDGASNILAYNHFPTTGDMTIDTDDAIFYTTPTGNYKPLKNTIMHEHGHGMGLGHVIPLDVTKLMEGSYSGFADLGPQDDDIRGGQRLYGDWAEDNDDVANATLLGSIVDSMLVENMSIDRGSTDDDYFQVTMSSSGIEIQVAPVGSSYLIGNEGGSTSPTATDSITDLDVEFYDSLGATLLGSATGGGIGATETISGVGLPYAGDYIIKVFRKAANPNATQRYTLTIYEDVVDQVAVEDDLLPAARSLGLVISPNPFNPMTQVRFNAPAAGEYSVEVFDISGRLVRTLAGRTASAGPVEVQWDGTDQAGTAVASGIFLMNVTTGDYRETSRATLIR